MRISVTDAKAQLTDLVRRAEDGEDVVLTRHGQPAARLVRAKRERLTREERRQLLESVSAEGAAKAVPGPSAARTQDFLYDERGLPE